MKRYAFLITLIFALLLTACTSSAPSPAASASAVRPEKFELTEKEQELADRYYELLKEQYPEFAAIPRELLKERVFIGEEYFDVSFQFCLGGAETNYECTYSTSPAYPEGKWEMFGNDYAQFASRTLSESELESLKNMLYDSMNAWIEDRGLEKGDLSPEDLQLYWAIEDGGLCACAEEIVSVQAQGTTEYGCGDHAHVFGKVLVEFTDNGVKLTDLGTSGG